MTHDPIRDFEVALARAFHAREKYLSEGMSTESAIRKAVSDEIERALVSSWAAVAIYDKLGGVFVVGAEPEKE